MLEEEANAWELLEDQAVYINRYLTKHLNQKELKERVLDECPPPINLKSVPILDTHIRELLQENGKFEAVHIDRMLKAIQDNLVSVFGPICYVWSNLEQARRESLQREEEDELEEPCRLFDQGIILLAQTFNNISYQRRLNLLSKLISSQTAVKEILKTQSETLDNPVNPALFGPSFDETLAKDVTVRGKAKSAFTALKDENAKPAPSGARRGRGGYPRGRATHSPRGQGFRNFGKKWPFRGGPRLQNGSGRGRGRGQSQQYRGGKKHFSFKFYSSSKPQVLSSSSKRDVSNRTTVEKVQHFLKNWEVLTQDPQVLEVVRVSGFSSWRSRYNG